MQALTRSVSLFLVVASCALAVHAQAPFITLEVEEVSTANAPAIHSTAEAEYNDLWVFVTGRIDGLHALFFFENNEAFPADMANNSVIVYDHEADQMWTASLDELSDAEADPLRTTNPQYEQDGSTLYVIGGYGYSHAEDEKITFGVLTAIDLPGIISAVQNATPLAPHIRQTAYDERLEVTGGHLVEFEGRYHLVGGNSFEGEYIGGNFIQEYTNAIRSFEIVDDGSSLSIANYTELVDIDHLHRRDGNLSPVILDDGTEGLALFGGVFQIGVNLPFRHPVYFDGTTLDPDMEFEAQFGHYTNPVLPFYDSDDGTMSSIFLGGLNQFYFDEDDDVIKEDPLVPFTDDVTVITRSDDGSTTELVLPVTLPGLLGTNALLFVNPALPTYANGVIKVRELSGRTLIGRVIGGIESDIPNAGLMFGTTIASDRLFELYATAHPVANENDTPTTFEVMPASPNPFNSEARINIRVDETQELSVEVFDSLGRSVTTLHNGYLSAGSHSLVFKPNHIAGGIYTVRIDGESGRISQRLVYVR